MRMKPKSTVHNMRALLYKRYTDLETSMANSLLTLYHTEDDKYWQFSAEMVKFLEFAGDPATVPDERKINAGGSTFQTYLKFSNVYYVYQIISGVGRWVRTFTSASGGSELVLSYNNIAEPHFFRKTESMNGLNISTNPFPQSIQITTTSAIEYVYLIIVTNSFQWAIYNRFFDVSEHEAGTYDIPLNSSGDAGDLPPNSAQYANKIYFSFTRDESYSVDSWDIEITVPTIPAQTLAAKFADIGRYQTNKYYLAGSFDYMIRGSIGSSDTQPIKGNIMHLRSFEIKYFDDNIHIDHDDLVVIDGRLYGVEELAYDIKRSPKPYTVYFATLNNIK